MIRKFVTEQLELDEKTITLLKELAEAHNATIDEVVNDILLEHISNKMPIKEFISILEHTKEPLREYYIILNDNEEPVARVVPYRD